VSFKGDFGAFIFAAVVIGFIVCLHKKPWLWIWKK